MIQYLAHTSQQEGFILCEQAGNEEMKKRVTFAVV